MLGAVKGWGAVGLFVVACGSEAQPEVDAGVPDAGASLPTTAAALSPERFDCTAVGPFRAPPRPHPYSCVTDPSCQARLIAGHRFAVPFAPENSLSALRAAILLGVDIAETDARLTKDGRVVLLHDAEIDRTVEGSGRVADFTLAELQALPLRLRPEQPGDFSCERVPTLEEALALSVGEIVLELEVKADQAGLAVARYLRDQQLYAHAYLLCDVAECLQLRAEVPGVPIMTRPRTPAAVAGALRFDPPPLLVHIDPTEAFLDEAILAPARAQGIKIFANGFILGDALALSGDGSGYRSVFEKGVDVQQVQSVHWALFALGRLPEVR